MKFEKLGNIADIIAGQSPPSSTYNSEGNGIPFFQGKADYGEKYPTVRYWCTEPTKISLPDDILISMRAPVGPVNINTVESCIGRGLSAIRVKKNVSRDFIYFWLKQNQHIIAAKQTGSTFKAITQKILSEIVVPFPNYSAQLHIANVLSKAENLIAQRKESIRLLDEFLKSTFLEMFGDPVKNEKGWEIKQLVQLVDKLGDGLHGTPEYDDNGDYYFINGNNLDKGFIRTDEKTKKVSYEEFSKHSKELNENTILVSINGTLGRVAFYRGEKIILGKSACYFNLKKGSIESLFLFHFLQSEFFLKYVTNKATGSTISNVSLKTMRELPIIQPPRTLQTQFAQIVEKTEALKTQYQQSLQELENLYGSLSQRAFRGELEVKKATTV